MIFFVSNSPFLGGAEYYLLDLLKGLKKDFSLKLACPDGLMRREGEKLGVDTLAINIGATLGRYRGLNLFNPLNIFRIRRIRQLLVSQLETSKQLIVQTQDFKELLLFTKASDGLPIKLIYVHHPIFPSWLYRNVLVSYYVKSAMIKQDKIVVVSSANKRELEKFGLGPKKIIRVYNGVDLNLFKPASAKKKITLRKQLGLEGKVTIGVNARISWDKGQDIVLLAMPKILKEVPNFHAVFVGGGSEFRWRRLHKIVKENNLKSNVTFLGTWSRGEVPNFYSLTDVFVLPSLREGLPLSIIEAMASALPCIGTRVAGIPEEIEDGKSGFLMDERDEAELADLCIKLLKNENLRRKMGEAGRRIAGRKFDKQAMIENTKSLFLELGKDENCN